MVGRKPSPLLPKRKKKPAKPKREAVEKQPTLKGEDQEIVSRPSREKKAKKPRVKRGFKPSAPQQQLSAEDKRVLRRRRQRRRLILRIAILVAVVGLAVLVWLNWDSLAPDKVWLKVQDWMGGGTGSYPVDLSGTDARRLDQVDNYTVMLTESHLIYHNADGAEVARYSCAYSDPLLRTEGAYVLVAEQGGTRLTLTTRNKELPKWETAYTIRSVSLNADGGVAVLTEGPQGYERQITVYDKEGKERYILNTNLLATDVALSPDGTTVSVMGVEAPDGALNTRLDVFDLTSTATTAKYTHTVVDSLLYRAEYLEDGTLAAVGEEQMVLLNTADGTHTAYAPQGMRILGYAAGDNTVALALRPYGDTAGGRVEVLSSAAAVQTTVSFDGEFRHLSGCNGRYALLTNSMAQAFSNEGTGRAVTMGADGRQAVFFGSRLVVMGLNRLDAYDAM